MKNNKTNKYLYISNVSIPLYRGRLIIILTNDIDRIKEWMPDFKYNYLYAHCIKIENEEETNYVVLLNFDNRLGKICYGTISHEALHTAHFIANDRGIEPSYSNDEPIAYLLEFITNQIHKFIERKGFEIET